MPPKVYVLHKYGAKSHYQGLEYLLFTKGGEVVYREFSIIGRFFKSIKKFEVNLMLKQFINLFFLIELLFTKNRIIVLGIAPFDKKLSKLIPLLKKHKIFYHTSWASWDGSFVPKSKKIKPKHKNDWRIFLQEMIGGVFAVTNTTKEELIKYYDLKEDKIHVVNHAFDNKDFVLENIERRKKSFVYVGRLVEEKGIKEILDFFSKNDEGYLTIIGKGKLENIVEEYASQFENINYLGYVSDKKELSNIFNRHEFMLLNSKKTAKWEELFGMVLIEGMACGLIPVASNHAGPREIINDNLGVLFEENNFKKEMVILLCDAYGSEQKYLAKELSERYMVTEVAKKWKPIIKK